MKEVVLMSLVFAAITPHPPIIIDEVGVDNCQQVKKTIRAMDNLSDRLVQSAPDVIVFITPHGSVFQDALSVTVASRLRGSFSGFGHPELAFSRESDVHLANQIVDDARAAGIAVLAVDEPTAKLYRLKLELDHGILVPLSFIDKAGSNAPIIPVSIGMLPFEELFSFGVSLGKTIRQWDGKVALIVSGDLSHRLQQGAPAGYHEDGLRFDQLVVEAVANGDARGVYDLRGMLAENAGECGLRPLVIAMGVFDGRDFTGDVLSYEGPFGVGYLVAEFILSEAKQRHPLGPVIKEMEKEQMQAIRSKESVFVRLARETLESYVLNGKIPMPPVNLPAEMLQQAGVFVSIKKDGQLRGCIGTIEPVQPSIAAEIIANAVSAGTRDPRFEPVMTAELDRLEYSVDILSPAEPIVGMDELDSKRYGVIVEKRGRRGLLLPNLEGVDTVEEQIQIAKSKAGIDKGEVDVKIWRFEVVRFR
jgi:AmmeMemoRadiSam system protein A